MCSAGGDKSVLGTQGRRRPVDLERQGTQRSLVASTCDCSLAGLACRTRVGETEASDLGQLGGGKAVPLRALAETPAPQVSAAYTNGPLKCWK